MNIWYPGHRSRSTSTNQTTCTGKNKPAGPTTYEPVGYWRSVQLETVRCKPATPKPAEPQFWKPRVQNDGTCTCN